MKSNRAYPVILAALGIAIMLLACIPGCIAQDDPTPPDVIGDGHDDPTGIPDATETPDKDPIVFGDRVDDWVYVANMMYEDSSTASHSMSGGGSAVKTYASPMAPSYSTGMTATESENIGFSVGGAKDIANFRENVEKGYLPLPTDVTCEGLFYDYYFDTGQVEACMKLFCPSYTYAVTRDPISGEIEYYLAVGLNSGIKESDFARKKLNLVVVLDISGSMSSSFDRYYYDQFGNPLEREGTAEDFSKSKMQLAAESVAALLEHLTDEDRFGMVLFNGSAHLAKPLSYVGETDMKAISDHVLEIEANGSTYMAAGMEMATDLFEDLPDVDPAEYENRIIFLTDAMPNVGEISEDGLLGMTENNADDGLHTTFIGIGVDFNTELIEHITKIRGANYYSVHSAKEFRERMDEEFEYMVTPLVFDLQLKLQADGWEIEKVYGSPEANEATGELMKVNTLFPSKTEGGETRGGLVLLKLKKTTGEDDLVLKVSYDDRNGNPDSAEAAIGLEAQDPEYFANTGIQKGVLLSRYADLLINWLIDEREHAHFSRPWQPIINDEVGIICPPPFEILLGKWERQSLPLMVSESYEALFDEFADYFEEEATAIDDETLEQELDILRTLTQG